jgi:hypothetical protein
MLSLLEAQNAEEALANENKPIQKIIKIDDLYKIHEEAREELVNGNKAVIVTSIYFYKPLTPTSNGTIPT